MSGQVGTNREVVLRIIDFLERRSTYHDGDLHISTVDSYLLDFIFACHILKRLRDPVSIPTLIRLVRKFGEIHSRRIEKNMESREEYGIRLARVPLKNVIDTLIVMGGEAVQPLIELLSSEHVETRKFAAYALGKIGDRRAFPALEKLFKGESGIVREVAGRALLQLDAEKAAEIVQRDNLTPTEDPLPHFSKTRLKIHLEAISDYYRSLDDLGPPSEYKLSVSLYKYVEGMVGSLGTVNYWREWGLGQLEIYELDLPREIVKMINKENMDEHFLPCLCGEYLEWAYVNAISKRLHDFYDDRYHLVQNDVICVYCKNCKRYTAIQREIDHAYLEGTSFSLFYLPRFPKEEELKQESEIKEKRETFEEEFEEFDEDM